MKKKVLFVIVFFIAIGFFVNNARAYTYDGEYDPNHFFTYEPLFVEQLTPITALIVVGKEKATPRYVVVCVMRVPGGLIILAYAYYDADLNLKHFMINKEAGHYAETPFNHNDPTEAELYKKLKSMLNAFYGFSTAENL